MRTALRLLNGVAAGAAAACLTGALIGMVQSLYGLLTGPRSTAEVFGAVWFTEMSVLFGGAIGVIPASLVMSLSRARHRPWRALPFLSAGATVGFFIVSFPIALALWRVGAPPYLALAISWLGPTVGGIIATRFVPAQDSFASPATGA